MWFLAVILLLAAPVAAAPFEDADIHLEVPAGWTLRATQPGGSAAGATAKLGPADAPPNDLIQVWRLPPGKPTVVPGSARNGVTKLGGVPAASFVWEDVDPRKPMSAARVHVLIRAVRGKQAWEIRADYGKPAGDLSVDRRWNTAMSLVVRGWRWKR